MHSCSAMEVFKKVNAVKIMFKFKHYDSIQCTVTVKILSEVTIKTRQQMVKSETKYTDFTKALLTFKMS
jgi:hypothetical protein